MSVDEPTARAYMESADGDLALAAYALITSMIVAASLPPPPRPSEIHAAAEAIVRALKFCDDDGFPVRVPIARDLGATCKAAGLSVFE